MLLRQDPPNNVEGGSNSSVVEVLENDKEPQAGPTEVVPGVVVVVEEVDIVDERVEEMMENTPESAPAMEEIVLPVRNPQEREVPKSSLERLSLEENPQGAPRRRNHFRIRFDQGTSPEASEVRLGRGLIELIGKGVMNVLEDEI